MKTLAPLIEQIRRHPLTNSHDAWAFVRCAAALQGELQPRARVIAYVTAALAQDIARLFDSAVDVSAHSQLEVASSLVASGLTVGASSGAQAWIEPVAAAISTVRSLSL